METLGQLESLLLWISIITIAVFLITVMSYYYRSRQKTNNYLGKQELELRYFIQRQVDYQGKLTGYECLLRERDADGHWRLPQNLETLPLQKVIFFTARYVQGLASRGHNTFH